MSNETNTQTEQVHQVTSVPPTTTTPVVEKPKRFAKTRNNVRHPIETVKRNKNAALLTLGAAAGAVSVVLLKSKLDNDEETVEDTEETSALENLYLLDDAQND